MSPAAASTWTAATVEFYRSTAVAFLCFTLAACTPQQMLLSALVPDGTASVMLGNLQGIADTNRQRIAELEQRGDWPGLAAFAEQNISRDPFSAEWRLVAGYAWSQAREFGRASAQFAEMVRIAPDEVLGYHLLAEAQRESGQPERAVVTLERALQIDREPAQTLRLQGDALFAAGSNTEAFSAYRRALSLDSRLEPAWWGYGRAALRLGRMVEARQAVAALAGMQSARAAELEQMIRRQQGGG